MNATTYSHHNLDREAGICWGAHAPSRSGDGVSPSRTLHFCREGPSLPKQEDVSATAPLQRMQSNGQAFQPAREARALPGMLPPHQLV